MAPYTGRLESRYDEAFPAPYLTVRVLWKGRHADLPGLLDTGADMSLVPNYLVSTLAMEKSSEAWIEGVSGPGALRDTYVIEMELAGYRAGPLEVSTSMEPYILVGRDVLNDLITRFDGPAETFSIAVPGAS